MRVAVANHPIFTENPITGWLTGDYDGLSVKLDKDLEGGPYLSVQPGGDYQGRPGGGGVYESFKKQGSDLVCAYQHEGTQYVHVVPFKEL